MEDFQIVFLYFREVNIYQEEREISALQGLYKLSFFFSLVFVGKSIAVQDLADTFFYARSPGTTLRGGREVNHISPVGGRGSGLQRRFIGLQLFSLIHPGYPIYGL